MPGQEYLLSGPFPSLGGHYPNPRALSGKKFLKHQGEMDAFFLYFPLHCLNVYFTLVCFTSVPQLPYTDDHRAYRFLPL